MKIPNHVLKGFQCPLTHSEIMAEASRHQLLSKWLVDLIRKSMVQKAAPMPNGRPPIDRNLFTEAVRKAADKPVARGAVILAMQSVFPVSKTTAIDILGKMEANGIITVTRGPFQWSPVMVQFVGGKA